MLRINLFGEMPVALDHFGDAVLFSDIPSPHVRGQSITLSMALAEGAKSN